MIRFVILAIACLVSGAGFAAAPPGVPLVSTKPVKVSATAARGPVFTRKGAIKDNGPDGPTTDVALARSKDGKMQSGLYDAGASEQDIESYPDDEFMFFIEGGVKLISADGSVLEVHAGEGAAIPKGWKGHWSTAGYKKFYVTYESGEAQ